MIFLLVALLFDANAPSAGLDPANVGLLRTIAPLGGELNGVAFSADGRRLVVGSADGAYVYETPSWRLVRRLEGHPDAVLSVAISPDGKRVAAGGYQGTILQWDVEEGKVLHSLGHHQTHVHALAFSPDGGTLVSGDQNGRVRIWEAGTGKRRSDLEAGPEPIRSIAFARDGSRLAVAGGALKIFRTGGWAPERELREGQDLGALLFSSDGRTLMGFGQNGARLWDLGTGLPARKVDLQGGAWGAGRFTPDGRHLVTSQGAELQVRAVAPAAEPVTCAHHTGAVTGIAVHPAGRMFVSIGQDRHLKVWGPVPGGTARLRGKGFLGVTVQNTAGGRVMISTVYPASAAESAGLRTGDLLLSVGGRGLETMTQAVDQIGSFQEGDEVEFEIERGGGRKSMKVKLGKRPAAMPND